MCIRDSVKRGKVFGDVFEINYREQAANVARNSVEPDHDRLTFADGFVLDAPCRSSFDAAMALVGEHGGVKTHQTLPKDAEALAEVLSKQKSRRDRLPDAERTEALSPLPVAELRKYEAVKKAHPDALVCFAQNGYFELYGPLRFRSGSILSFVFRVPSTSETISQSEKSVFISLTF